ncbi:MAG TPA: hypothetical protein PKO03_02480 [Anaerolineaceae bacterium]|nr:hypothetical protein [Anaerolineaceae bacterium]HNS38521.1 hypothetical protein [Anaerolineaceae bacterium]HNZ12229.1 hypothetical protein [Anaerolineaceae bacterium]HOG78202.1 hypothetical protein [Anaerolineaceae bacterium]
MVRLELSPEQYQLLVELLESCLSDLRMEIVDTDRIDYKDMLKDRKDVLLSLLETLRSASA